MHSALRAAIQGNSIRPHAAIARCGLFLQIEYGLCVSVLLVTFVRPAKTATDKLVEMPFGG